MNSVAPKVNAFIQSEMNGDFFPRSVNLVKGHVDTKRKEILYTFLETFDRYESLFTFLKDEQAFYEKPIALRHPLIFYLGHTAVFFINKLLLAKAIEKRINPKFESMFAVGINNQAEYYTWDNEYGTRKAEVEPFEASKYLVSNREFFEFFKDNGYLTDKCWSEEGLQWREFSNVSHPTFWVWRGEWHLRLLGVSNFHQNIVEEMLSFVHGRSKALI